MLKKPIKKSENITLALIQEAIKTEQLPKELIEKIEPNLRNLNQLREIMREPHPACCISSRGQFAQIRAILSRPLEENANFIKKYPVLNPSPPK